MIKKIEEKEDEVFFKFELDRLDLFHLSAILSAVAFKQGKVFEEFGKDADRLMRKLYYQTHKEEKEMQLKDTVEMMNSKDYKERFKAEYYQLLLRLDALTDMLIKWENNMLDFEPKCAKETLENQVIFMQGYIGILRLRAEIEGIDLYIKIH